MSVTFDIQEQRGPTTWYFAWSSTEDEPSYRVYIDGELIDTTPRAWRQVEVEAGEQIQIEVRDDATAPQSAYPGRVYLSWIAAEEDDGTAADKYQVDEYVDSEWTTRDTIESHGESWFQWRSRYLEDCTTHLFRVIPVMTSGNEGTTLNFSVLMVRRPDRPTATYSYSSDTTKVTITVS